MRKIPEAVKRRRHLARLLREAETDGAANHYVALLAPFIVGYDVAFWCEYRKCVAVR